MFMLRANTTPKLFVSDSFGRSAGGLGTNYTSVHTGASGDLQISSGQEVTFNGTTDGTETGIWTVPLLSDHIAAQIQITSSIAAPTSTRYDAVLIGNATGTAVCALRIGTTTLSIWTGAHGSLTSRASASRTNSNGQFFTLTYDPTTNTYTGVNSAGGTSVSWTDSTNIMSHGASNRYAGFSVGRASFTNAGNIGYFQAQDL